MQLHFAIAAVLSVATSGALAVNRCVAPDGSITFQEAACPNSARSSAPVKIWDNTIDGGNDQRHTVAPLRFTESKTENATLAAGALEVLSTGARDCRIELKVRPESSEAFRSCSRYLAQRNAWWSPAIKELAALVKDNEWGLANSRTVTSATESIDKVNEAHAFIKLRLGLRQ